MDGNDFSRGIGQSIVAMLIVALLAGAVIALGGGCVWRFIQHHVSIH